MENRITLGSINSTFFNNTEKSVTTDSTSGIQLFGNGKGKTENSEPLPPEKEYTIENLRNKYPASDYDIKNSDGIIMVTKKDENTKVFSVQFNDDKSVEISKYNEYGDKIEQVIKNQYGITTQKKIIDPYDIGTKELYEYDDSGILQQHTDIYIEYKDGAGMKTAKITTYKDGKPYKIQVSDPEIPVKFPMADNIKSKMDSNDPTVVDDILQLTPDTVVDILQNFYMINKKEDWLDEVHTSLLNSINESSLPNSAKKKAVSHLQKTIESAAKQAGYPVSKKDFDYDKAITYLAYKQVGVDINFSVQDTQISNPYYTGDKYSLQQDGMTITITNKNTNSSKQINLEKLLQNYVNIQEKAEIIKLIQKVPPEVLMDLAVEIETFKPPLDLLDIYNENALGYYYSTTNQIAVNVGTDLQTFIHEMGHAVDHIGKDVGGGSLKIEYSLENNPEFSKIYEEELQKYLADGNTIYDFNDPNADRSLYATANIHELFAECYDLLMRGDSGSKDILLKYFPKTLEFIKEQIKINRSQSDYARRH